jgi:outer membrane protein assembly factor BamB
MHLFHRLSQRRQASARISRSRPLLLAALLLLGAFLVEQVAGQFFQVQPRRRSPAKSEATGQDAVSGVYLPNDRALSRAIARARERLADHEYHEVLAFLQQVLSRDEDSFLERSGDDHQQLGLKATARQMIGELPSEGYEAYELLNGATARRQLESAIRSGDREALAKVVRQYFHTSAGYESALVLAEMEADLGHRLAAAQLYRELIETPRAAAKFEPQLSIAAALNYLAADQREEAAATLRALAKRSPSAQVMLSGKSTLLPSMSADPVAWLSGLVGQPLQTTSVDSNWLMLHGDPSRNSLASGGRPHLRPRWEARVVNEPSIESYLSRRSDDFVQRGIVAIPGARPIAMGDVVIMRTPQNIVAVDWQTGKRIWETRDEQELQPDILSPEPAPGFVDRDQWPAQGKSLEDRVWDDALMASLSSDGKRVFTVRGMTMTRDEEAGGMGAIPMFGRGGVELGAATNQLAAYDIATQGKLSWELDGARANGKLAGAFFLGTPLAIDNTLYVMVEIRSALYLMALDPATGHVQWQQQLVGLEQGISVDSIRRKAGAAPAYSGGILVCPTVASSVIAIDVVKREFAWVYRYPREAQSVGDMRQFWQNQAQVQLVRSNNNWLDSSAVIAEGRVIVTPPDSNEIHCIDLHSGKLVWKRRQNDFVFVGSVHHGNVLLVGAQSVQALKLSDGAPAWEQETRQLPTGSLPVGQGYLSDGHYFLPLTSGQVADIDMAAGKLTSFSPAGSNVELGNLICHRGSVLSQSALVLDKFEQLDVLRRRTEAALARNANDPTAIRERAELMRADNQKPEAVKLLKRAYELAPNDLVTQEMLVELLLEELSSDYAAFRTDVPLVSKLVRNRDQQIELLRIDAAGLDAAGERSAAWDAYMKLADFTADEPAYLQLGDKYTVRSDRWIAGQLAATWSNASADERRAIENKLVSRKPSLQNVRTSADLRHYLNHLDQLPGADEIRGALADFLIERGRLQEAEIELLQLTASDESSSQTKASELLKKLLAKNSAQARQSSPNWPRGHVDSEIVSANAPPAARIRPDGAMAERQQPTTFRQLRIEQNFAPQISPMHWFVAMDCTEITGRNSFGEDVFHLNVDPNNLANQYRDSGLLHGASLGSLLYVALGGHVVAIDSLRDKQSSEGDILWPDQTPDEFDRDIARPRRGPGNAQSRANHRPVYHTFGRKRIAGAAGAAQGSLGPVTPRGIVLQDDNELKCVDPLTGITLWARTDIPTGCELFGDNELVFAADVTGNVAYVVRLVDGQSLEKRELNGADWLMTAGRNVAQLTNNRGRGKTGLVITVTDVWARKKLCEVELPTISRISLVEPNAIAAFDPSGQFRLIDVAKGKVTIDEKLEAAPDLQSIYTVRAGDDLYLFVSGQVQSQFKSIGQTFDYPMTNGPVYAFNLTTGKSRWPGPALARNRGIVLSEPADVPLLVFIDRQNLRDAAAGGGSQLRVLCLDKRTGETVYRNDRLPDANVTRFRIEASSEPRPQVALDLGTAKIQLTLTDRPRPPQPPANDDLEAAKEVGERGLRGLGAQLGGALRGALEKSTPDTPAQRHRPTDAKRADAAPAKNGKNDVDDD